MLERDAGELQTRHKQAVCSKAWAAAAQGRTRSLGAAGCLHHNHKHESWKSGSLKHYIVVSGCEIPMTDLRVNPRAWDLSLF